MLLSSFPVTVIVNTGYFFYLESFLLISGISGFSLFTIEHIRKPVIYGKFLAVFWSEIFPRRNLLMSLLVWLSAWSLLWNFLLFPWFRAFPANPENRTGHKKMLKKSPALNAWAAIFKSADFCYCYSVNPN